MHRKAYKRLIKVVKEVPKHLLSILEGSKVHISTPGHQDHALRLFVELIPDLDELQIPAGIPNVHPEVLPKAVLHLSKDAHVISELHSTHIHHIFPWLFRKINHL